MTTRRPDIASPSFSDEDSPPASNLSSMQRAIVTIQKLRGKVESLERARTESIAIVGMACRFPGGANTPDAFFQLLENGVDAVTEVPPERWRLEQESADSPGEERALRWGAFLKDVDLFDAAFFGISPREAESLDPQQRLLLEVSWEALERAGQLPERLMGSKTGIFVGIWALDYHERLLGLPADKLDAYCLTGNMLSTAAGRLSYTLGLQGPCMTVETACSSSLTAVHLACQSLRMGESSLALAGGVNLMLSPTTTKLLSKTQALSPDGRCKTFDARANGYVRGEGCGMLVLKRLTDAERDGDTILALIRGSAVNQDGRSTGLTAPNVLSQQSLLRQALESARITAQDIGYVETHGTGTSLGDPIEVDAIKAVFGAPREKGTKCVLGALKTNIGHLEAAAGVAGIIKVILALQNEKIPGNLHFRSLNPRIDLNGTSLEIACETRDWSPGIRTRFAGVSSFGISGTNAHIILEEAPRNLEEALLDEDVSTCLLPISARTQETLHEYTRAIHETLMTENSSRLLDIVYTASARRSHYEHRLSVIGRTKGDIASQLGAYLRGEEASGVAQGSASSTRPKVVFVFSGQGAQWAGMGRDLYQADASFRSVIDTCDNLMTSRLGWSILDELEATEAVSRLTETHVAQPLLFAIQVALVEMLRSWGIAPDAMIGHGLGEVAAAHTAGILSLDEAIRLVTLRGRIMQKAAGMGKMAAISASAEVARQLIANYNDRVAIAAINDNRSVILSGESTALDEIVARCEKRGLTVRHLHGDYPLNGPQLEAIEREFVERVARVDTRRATLAMYSSVLADCIDGKELDVRYWGRNLLGTVEFAAAVSAAIRDGYRLFVEIGPHPNLVPHIQQSLSVQGAAGYVVGTLQQKQDGRRTLLSAAGALYTHGCSLEWTRLMPSGGRCVPLQTYPWLRKRFWLDLPKQSPRTSTNASSSSKTSQAIRPKVVFVFPGQGSQWLGMGKQLIATEPSFRTVLEACDVAIQKEADFSILSEIFADDAASRLHEIDVVQPLLFSIEIALAALWRAKGVEPDCVVGHSMGEVAAAYVAGMLRLEDAIKVICRRSKLLKRIRGQGAMALVELPMIEAQAAIEPYATKLSVAVSNGPRSTVLSGDPTALSSVISLLEERGVYCRKVKVDVASHSPQVDSLQEDLILALRDLAPMPGTLHMQSTVTTEPIAGKDLLASYWVQNLRAPVRFSDVTRSLLERGHSIFIEVSPHPVLLPSIEENIHELSKNCLAVASLRRQANESTSFSEAIGAVETFGHASTGAKGHQNRQLHDPSIASAHHPLRGHRIRTSAQQGAFIWQFALSQKDTPWLWDHRVANRVIVPGAVYVEVALSAIHELIGDVGITLENLSLVHPLVLDDDSIVLAEAVLTRSGKDKWNFSMSSSIESDSNTDVDSSEWTLHATGQIHASASGSCNIDAEPIDAIQMRCPAEMTIDELLRAEAGRGLEIGPSFQPIRSFQYARSESISRLTLPNALSPNPGYLAHPALLDGAFRSFAMTEHLDQSNQTLVLTKLRRLQYHSRIPSNVWCHSRVTPGEDGEGTTHEQSVTLFDSQGRIALEIEGIETQAIQLAPAATPDPLAHLLLDEQWELSPPNNNTIPATTPGHWLLLCDDDGVGANLRDRLVSAGAVVQCIWIRNSAAPSQPDREEVDPASGEQVNIAVSRAIRRAGRVDGVVYLWGSRRHDVADISAQSLQTAFARGCAGALHVVQTIHRMNLRDNPRLWLVARGTQKIPDESSDILIEQATLWGFGRAIAIEAPDLRCARVDLDPRENQDEMPMLVRELLADGHEEEIAIRGTRRYVGRLVPGHLNPALQADCEPQNRIRNDGTYLVTGGLGTLGLLSAQWLHERGARHLVLQGRQGITTDEQRKAIEVLKAQGTDVQILAIDVSDFERLQAGLRTIEATMPPLRGIVHSAGLSDNAALQQQTLDHFRRAFAPKVQGALNVFLATRDAPLDFFVLYSSTVGLLGAMGMANYVAANVFLNSFAYWIQAQGKPALSVAWGFFADVGQGLVMNRDDRVKRQGLEPMSGKDLAGYLDRLVCASNATIGIAGLDIRQWLDFHPQMTGVSRIESLVRARNVHNKKSRAQDGETFLTMLRSASAENRISMLQDFVRQKAASVLRMDPMEVDIQAPLRALGIDSLMGMELRNQFERELGLQLSATLVFNHPHVAAIARHLLDKLALDSTNDSAASHDEPTTPTMGEEPESIAEDDILAELDRELSLARTRKGL